jgi:hypothetical protein
VKNVVGFGLVFCLFAALTSCNYLSPVDYDKAGRDIMAFTSDNASLTVAEYRNIIRQSGWSSKDYLSLISTDTINQLVWILSSDMEFPETTEIRKIGIDAKNLQRARMRIFQ